VKKPTAVIAEDEPLLRTELREALHALWPGLSVVAEAGDGVSAIAAVREHSPDIAFLDINMPGLTGLEVARVLRDRVRVVFVTAYNQHALEAFDVGALDYLTKPINKLRLMQAIERLQAGLGQAPRAVSEATLATLLQPAPAAQRKPLKWIQASVGNLLRLITVEEIFFFQSDAKYTRVVTAQVDALIRKPIRELAEELDPDVFIQVSRSAIVNLHRVESVYREDGLMEVRLKGRPERINVSTGYQSAFRQI
jgi:DNA-binding LytR/AlgR family response regulator